MIVGIELLLKFEPPAPFTDEWLDALYTSLEGNMAIKSVDMFSNEDEGELKFLLGVEAFSTSDEEFFMSIATDAIEKALDDAAGPNKRAADERTINALAAFA